ncbi:MAG: type 2 lantipeptide synthetase LanM family protein [Chroococcidiopsidaceae cyanobacterium CP_BM_RX_35]|nr:type 2 lantipeptide synthetase LanM family protein [Chroococcidiopsidaceae cyanobacterium CP_BM_RX_35]
MTVINRAITQSDLANIVAQARSLSERLSERLIQGNSPKNQTSTLNDECLDRWCEVVSKGDWEQFRKRLQWDELDINTVLHRLSASSVPFAETQLLPNWAATLQRIMQTALEWNPENKESQLLPSVTDPQNPLPFEDLFLPALHVANQQLLTRLSSKTSLKLLSESAYGSLLRHLLCKLINLCEQTLDVEFSQFRPFGYRILLLGSRIDLASTDTQYRAFVQLLLQEGMLNFFQKYPVLGRLLATQINFWVEATAEFLQRLEADHLVIQQVFQPQQSDFTLDLGTVTEIEPHLSDPHHQGRSVIALTFASGLKLVYKPKNLGLEVAYNQLLDWCNQHGVPLPLRVLKVLNRQTYGWVEYVEQLPCENEAAAKRFYQRSGMLLCLLHVLGTSDCHHENLIASGEHLMLVDLETLMHPEALSLQDTPEATILRLIYQKFWDSVLRTGLLPRWHFNGRVAYDISGLGSVDPQSMPRQVPDWKSVNRDDMHRGYKDIMMPVAKNIAILNGVALSPNHYLEELIEGFEQFYRFLIQHQQALLSSPILTALQGQPVRFLFRPTDVYATVLQHVLSPKFLQDGVARSIELNILARAFLTSQDKPNAWSIFHEELRAMEQSDIPYFLTHSDSTTLEIRQGQPAIAHYFEAPSYSQVITRLQKLDDSDRFQQIKLIRESFTAREARSPESSQLSPYVNLKSDDALTYSPLTRKQLLSAAGAIAEKIQAHAIQQSDGSVYWISLDYIAQTERFQLQPLEMSLYNGNCGIALFLAALDYIRGTHQFRHLTLGAVQNLHRILQTVDTQFRTRLAERTGIGGITGLGSILYALVRINQFLAASPARTSDLTNPPGEAESTLIQDAQMIAQLFTRELVATDRQFDLMSGSAGAILGLLTLYQATQDRRVLDKAILCGQHLLEHRTSSNGLPRAWKSFADRPLTGFSHGAAGIAYALLRLYAVTQNSDYLAAAMEGIEYERSVFLPTAANWSDFRSSTQQQEASQLMISWCNGAAGIGLGRLGGLSLLATDTIYEDIETALQTTQRYGLDSVDQLCCGNFGRIELLLVAAQKLSRPELLKLAKQQAAWSVARAKHAGGYSLTPNASEPMFSPNFFAGTAGIGYELLRLGSPEALPSVLLLE